MPRPRRVTLDPDAQAAALAVGDGGDAEVLPDDVAHQFCRTRLAAVQVHLGSRSGTVAQFRTKFGHLPSEHDQRPGLRASDDVEEDVPIRRSIASLSAEACGLDGSG